MQLGIIADTHDNVAAIEAATTIFVEAGVETLLHCGDFIAPPVLPFFDGFQLHGVLGNNDGEVDGLTAGFDALGSDSTLHGRFAELDLGGWSIAALHGEDLDVVSEHASSGAYDLVCYGHHHERECRIVDETLVLNPGGHFPTIPEEHRTVAIVDTEGTGTDAVRFHSVRG